MLLKIKNKGTEHSVLRAMLSFSVTSSLMISTCMFQEDIRASKKDFESESGRRYGGVDLWHHLECFAKLRGELEFWNSGSKLPGYHNLKAEDQEKVRSLLPEMKP